MIQTELRARYPVTTVLQSIRFQGLQAAVGLGVSASLTVLRTPREDVDISADKTFGQVMKLRSTIHTIEFHRIHTRCTEVYRKIPCSATEVIPNDPDPLVEDIPIQVECCCLLIPRFVHKAQNDLEFSCLQLKRFKERTLGERLAERLRAGPLLVIY